MIGVGRKARATIAFIGMIGHPSATALRATLAAREDIEVIDLADETELDELVHEENLHEEALRAKGEDVPDKPIIVVGGGGPRLAIEDMMREPEPMYPIYAPEPMMVVNEYGTGKGARKRRRADLGWHKKTKKLTRRKGGWK